MGQGGEAVEEILVVWLLNLEEIILYSLRKEKLVIWLVSLINIIFYCLHEENSEKDTCSCWVFRCRVPRFSLPVGEQLCHSLMMANCCGCTQKSQQTGIREKHITYKFLACGLTTSLTEETGTVRGEGVGGGERGAAVEAGAGGWDAHGGAAEAGAAGVLCDGAGSVLLEGEQDTLSVFRSVELSKAGVSWKHLK